MSEFIKAIGIKESDIEEAKDKGKKIIERAKDKGLESIEQDEINKDHKVGLVGELIFQRYLDFNNLDYEKGVDFEADEGIDFTLDGLNIDVKTVNRSVPPREDYQCSLPEKQLSKDADIYVFISLHLDDRMGYICGWLPVEKFKDRSSVFEEGEEMGSGREFKWRSRVCRVNDLYPIKELIK